MSDYSIKAVSVQKNFGRRLIFNDINFSLENPGTLGISGINGSGKSTLLKILAGLIGTSKGKIIHSFRNNLITHEDLHNYIGFVSPYLVLYEEFTAWENLVYFSKIRDFSLDEGKVNTLLNKFLIYERRHDTVKTFSSGMKQRLKYIFALMHSPKLILLDEPTSNLDSEGKHTVYSLIEEESKNNIIILASNDESDLSLCQETINLQDFKNLS
jgi:heme exporter protein A